MAETKYAAQEDDGPSHRELGHDGSDEEGGNIVIRDLGSGTRDPSSLAATTSRRHRPYQDRTILMFVVLCALTTALLSAAAQIVIDGLYKARRKFAALTTNPFGSYMLWLLITTAMFMAACVFTFKIYKHAGGSGVPQLKVWLSGTPQEGWLSFRCLCVKWVGMCFGAATVFMGALGPFVHIGAMVCNSFMTHVKPFRRFKENRYLYKQLITVSASIGIAVAFGVPIGGTVYGLEVTSSLYHLRNLWWTIIVTSVGGIIFLLFFNMYFNPHGDPWKPILHDSTEDDAIASDAHYHGVEYILFSFLGVLCGVLALLTSTAVILIQYNRRRAAIAGYRLYKTPYFHCLCIVVIVATLTAPSLLGEFTAMPNIALLKSLLSAKMTGLVEGRSLLTNCTVMAFVRLLVCPLVVATAVPGGIFLPTSIVGCAWGRLFGEIVFSATGGSIFGVTVRPAGYALVGAAAFTGSMTQAIAPVLIFMEMTGSMHYIFPMFVAMIMGQLVGRPFMPSIFDTIIAINGWKYFPSMRYFLRDFDTVQALESSHSELAYVSMDNISPEAVQELLQRRPLDDAFAVVPSARSMKYLGMVSREHLAKVRAPEEIRLDADLGVIMLSPSANMTDAHMMFTTSHMNVIPVVGEGTLVGVVRKEDIRLVLGANSQKLLIRFMKPLPENI